MEKVLESFAVNEGKINLPLEVHYTLGVKVLHFQFNQPYIYARK